MKHYSERLGSTTFDDTCYDFRIEHCPFYHNEKEQRRVTQNMQNESKNAAREVLVADPLPTEGLIATQSAAQDIHSPNRNQVTTQQREIS